MQTLPRRIRVAAWLPAARLRSTDQERLPATLFTAGRNGGSLPPKMRPASKARRFAPRPRLA
jgi:hypothetical protein